MTQQVRTHVREHASLLAAAETRALVWMADRLPRSVGSDHLTVLGLPARVRTGAAYWVASAQPLALWLAVNWFGDSLDGTVSLLYKPWVVIGETPYRLFDVGGVVAIAGVGLALTFAVARNTRDLYRAEPLPR